MIEAVQIQNFRCFKNASVRDLKRINLLVGKNAGGKTAFLEALFVNRAADPRVALRIRSFRGLAKHVEISREPQSYEALWKDLFYQFNHNQRICVEVEDSTKGGRTLEIFYEEVGAPALLFGKTPLDSDRIRPERIAEVVFRWVSPGGTVVVRPRFTDLGLVFQGTGESQPAIFFGPSFREAPEQSAERFSNLSKRGEEQAVVAAIQHEYPFVKSLSVEIDAGVATIYASLGEAAEKIPVPLVSDGINKLLGILLGMASYPGGVILIDEVENGIFHERLPSVWALMRGFADRFNVQVFATTHSRESIEAAAEAMLDHEDDLCLLRAEKEDGEARIYRYSGAELTGAIQHGFEIR